MSKTFQNMANPEAFEDSLLLVDGLNLAFRWKHQKATEFLDDYVKTVQSLAKSYHCGKVVILTDYGGSNYRKALYPEYKQNRAELKETQSDEDREYFELFLQEYSKTLDYFESNTNIPVIKIRGVEADDIAAHIVNNKQKYGYEQIWLVSSDKDWDLLVQDGVSRFSYVTRKETTVNNFQEIYDCTPEEYVSVKALQGDTGDNIIGVSKVGPKTAVKLVKQYGSVLDIADGIPLAGKYVYIKNINEFGSDRLLLNLQLVDLISFCDEAIGQDNIQIIKEKVI